MYAKRWTFTTLFMKYLIFKSPPICPDICLWCGAFFSILLASSWLLSLDSYSMHVSLSFWPQNSIEPRINVKKLQNVYPVPLNLKIAQSLEMRYKSCMDFSMSSQNRVWSPFLHLISSQLKCREREQKSNAPITHQIWILLH